MCGVYNAKDVFVSTFKLLISFASQSFSAGDENVIMCVFVSVVVATGLSKATVVVHSLPFHQHQTHQKVQQQVKSCSAVQRTTAAAPSSRRRLQRRWPLTKKTATFSEGEEIGEERTKKKKKKKKKKRKRGEENQRMDGELI